MQTDCCICIGMGLFDSRGPKREAKPFAEVYVARYLVSASKAKRLRRASREI